MRISPEVGSAKPAIIRIRLVLPHPEGPRMEKKDPFGTASDTPATARNGP